MTDHTGSTTDARKRHQEAVTPDMVQVPVELFKRLAYVVGDKHWLPSQLHPAARALVDSVGRPADAGCTCPPDEFLSPSDCALHGDDAPNQFRHSNGEELGIPDNLTTPPTPRVARSVEDLRAGQVVAWYDDENNVYGAEVDDLGDWKLDKDSPTLFILSDPEPPAPTLPTTPGSVAVMGDGRLWMKAGGSLWIRDDAVTLDQSALTLIRVLFDAALDAGAVNDE